jgi:ribose transport system permease protein
VVIIVVAIAASFVFKPFASPFNLKRIALNMSTDAIVSVGMMILLISGVFDLSVGSVYALSGAVSANLMYYHHVNTWLAVSLAILVCLSVGLSNGVLVAKVGVNPLIVTLAMMGIVRGAVYLVAGTGIIDLPDAFLKIADRTVLGLRIPVWYMILIAVIFSILVSKTTFFRKYYYIGGNEKAAALSGINVIRMRVISFIIVAGLAAIAGVIITSRLGTSVSTTGTGLEFRCITAAVLGGASLFGGQGTVMGAVLGTLFVALINNLMIMARTSVYWQSIVLGLILIIAVTLDALIKKRTV